MHYSPLSHQQGDPSSLCPSEPAHIVLRPVQVSRKTEPGYIFLFSSYTTAPCELWFSALKRGRDLNPNALPLSKGAFTDIVQMVIEQALMIPLAYRILFWRHCTQHLYRYLGYQEM